MNRALAVGIVVWAVIGLRFDGARCAADVAPSTSPATRPQTQPGPPPSNDASAIPVLVVELSGADWRARDEAQRRLALLGEDARPALEKLVADTTDAEVRNRALDALRQIGEGGRTGASRITMHLKDAPPQDAIAELSRQAQSPIQTWPDTMWRFRPRGPVTIDIDRQPFWVAVREVCDKLRVRPEAMGVDGAFTLVDNPAGGDPFPGPSVMSGPFLIVAGSANEGKSVTYAKAGAGNASHTLNMNLTIYAEPKLRILGRSYRLDGVEALDEAGNSLVPAAAGSFMEGWDLSSRDVMQVSVALKPGTGAKRVAKLRAVQKVRLQTKTVTAEIPDVLNAKNVSRDLAGVRLTLQELKKEGSGSISMRLSYAAANNAGPAAWLRLPGRPQAERPAVSIDLRVVDVEGNVLSRSRQQFSGGQGSMGTSSSIGRGDGKPAGEPAKLILEATSEIRDIDVPFEFTDLPLP